jgi:hypothetical protein
MSGKLKNLEITDENIEETMKTISIAELNQIYKATELIQNLRYVIVLNSTEPIEWILGRYSGDSGDIHDGAVFTIIRSSNMDVYHIGLPYGINLGDKIYNPPELVLAKTELSAVSGKVSELLGWSINRGGKSKRRKQKRRRHRVTKRRRVNRRK